jgi:hypothetical protein
MLYSKTTGGFYDPAIHGSDVPPGCVEISAARHAELLASQSAGKAIVADGSFPKAIDAAPAAPGLDSLRSRRNALLAACDWTQLADAPLSADGKAAWAAYRQALRNLPATFPNAANVVWPEKP